jgi:predicted regulator of amino acid metabolism with ACT domain
LREIARLWFGVYKANKYEPINLKVEQIAQQVGKERRRVGEDIDKIEKKVRAYFKKHELYPYYKSLRTPYLE